MNTRLFIVSLLIITFLFGCVLGSAKRVQRSKIAERAKTELIGKTKKDILSCAGTPVRSEQSGNQEYFTYIVGGGYNLGQVDQDGNVPEHARYCEIIFIFNDNQVTELLYKGRTGAKQTQNEQCAFLVGKCLPQ